MAREVARRTRGAEQVRRRAPPCGAQVWGMLAKLPRAPGPGRGKKNAAAPESFLKVIAAEGIRYFSAQLWQRWTRVPEAECRETLSWGINHCAHRNPRAALQNTRVSGAIAVQPVPEPAAYVYGE